MNRQKPGWRILSLVLLNAAWLGVAGYSKADSPTPGTGTQPSFPKQKDVSPFDSGTAAVIQKSANNSAALNNAKVQPGVKVGTDPGPVQKGTQVGIGPGPIQKGTKVGINLGPIQKGTKVRVGPGPVQRLNKGALGQGSDMSTSDQLKLQKAMENKSQFESTLSNTMKKNQNAQKGMAGSLK